jgi:hypothetical protein
VLYSERWEIEGALDEFKTHQRGPRVVLRSKQPHGVYQETYGYLCTHYAIRRVMHDAALRADLDPDRLSFTRSLRAARRSARTQPGFPPTRSPPPMSKQSPRFSRTPRRATPPLQPARDQTQDQQLGRQAPRTPSLAPANQAHQPIHHYHRRLKATVLGLARFELQRRKLRHSNKAARQRIAAALIPASLSAGLLRHG